MRSPWIVLTPPLFVMITSIAYGAAGDDYPARAVRIIVPTAPGGGAVAVTRPIGQKLSSMLGQSFVVDTRPGAAGATGSEIAARAAPDGYTLLMFAGSQAASVNLFDKQPFDPIADFAPITHATNQAYVLVVNPTVAANNVKDLIALAKAKPGTLAYASSGTGGLQHLAGVLLESMSGTKFTHAPYKGGAPAINDVVSGTMHMSFNSYILSAPHMKANRVRALAVTTSKRAAVLPNVPTMAETLPGYNAANWYGFLAPAKTPAPIVDKLYKSMTAALQDKEVREKLMAEDCEIVASTPQAFTAHLKAEIAKWNKLIKDNRIKL